MEKLCKNEIPLKIYYLLYLKIGKSIFCKKKTKLLNVILVRNQSFEDKTQSKGFSYHKTTEQFSVDVFHKQTHAVLIPGNSKRD